MTYKRLTLSLASGLLAGCCGTAAASPAPWYCDRNPTGTWVCTPAPPPSASPLHMAPAATQEPVRHPVPGTAGPTPPPTADTAGTANQSADRNRWRYCCALAAPASAALPLLPPGSPTRLTADHASIRGNHIYQLRGHVIMNRPGQRLTTDYLHYNKETGMARARGHMQLVEKNITVRGTRARLKVGKDRGEVHDAHYRVPARHARGSARTIYLEGPGLKRLQHATYTTCAAGHDDWLLSARQVKLFEDEGIGVAHDVKVAFKGVPILYSPYLRFPISDRRMSGFLVPRIGSSGTSGADIQVPYYWNIAPNRDATITPRIMSKRGILLGMEFRYLNPHDRGKLNLDYLPSDRQYGASRYQVGFHDHAAPLPHLVTDVLFNQVSDSQYFQDFGNTLDTATITDLERHAQATYFGSWWSLFGQAQDYQTIDPAIPVASRPYQRMPQLIFQGTPALDAGGLHYHLYGEYVRFARSNNPPGSPLGTRLDLKPQVSLPLTGAAYFVKPALALEYTRYQLHNTAPGQPADQSRTLPLFHVDSGLFLQRNITIGSRHLLQTLEPRAYYLYVPYRNQTNIPLFDTGLYDFNFGQMFQPNRFSGPDRVGDANQLTLAVTSRLLDPDTGAQQLSASLGRIYYFRNRRVTLSPGQAPATRHASDLVGNIDLQLAPDWQATANLQWNPTTHQPDLAGYQLHYQRDGRHIANFTYLFRRNLLRQADLSFLWPLTSSWSAVGSWNYSLLNRQTVDAFVGVQYDSCCWAVQIVSRNYIDGVGGRHNHSLYLQLVLKGLGDIGNPVGALLESGILGYQPNY